MSYISNGSTESLQNLADKIGITCQQNDTVATLRGRITNYCQQSQIYSRKIDVISYFVDQNQQQLRQSGIRQYGLKETASFFGKKQDDNLRRYRREIEPKSLDLLSMRSIAQDVLRDQIQPQAIAKNMINNAVGVGDPSLVAISNVNAQLASGIYNYKNIQPYLNYNALQNQPSQDVVTKELLTNQYKEREDIINEATQKEIHEVLHQDKGFETENNQEQLGNDVLEGIPLASPVVEPQQQKSLVQEQAEQDKIEDLQANEMTRMNDAINYKLGSLDWGLNSLNAVQFPEKVVSMRINDKISSYIQMNKALSKVEKVNQAKIKKNFISEKQMTATIEAQKELKKKYDKKQLKKKGNAKGTGINAKKST